MYKKVLTCFFIAFLFIGCNSISKTTHKNIIKKEHEKHSTSFTKQTYSPEKMPLTIKEIKIALLLPLSGKQENLGKQLFDAAQLALYDLDNTKIHLVLVDNKKNTDKIITILLKEKINIVLGDVSNKKTTSFYKAIQDSGITMLSLSSKITSVNLQNIYYIGFMKKDMIKAILSYLAPLDYKEILVVLPENQYGKIIEKMFNEEEGDRIKHSILWYGIDGKNNDKIFKEISTKQADGLKRTALILGDDIKTVINHIKVFQKIQGLSIITWDLTEESLETIRSIPAKILTAEYKLDKDFKKKFIENFGYTPSRLSSIIYDGVIIINSLGEKKEGAIEFTPSLLLKKEGFDTINGHLSFEPDGSNIREVKILTVDKGLLLDKNLPQ